MKRKILTGILVVCLALGGLGMFGCGRGTGDDQSKLVIYAGEQWQNTDAANLNAYFDWFNEQYSEQLGFEVEVSIRTSINTELSGQLMSGKGGDLYILDRYTIPSYVSSGAVREFDDFIDGSDKDLSLLNEASVTESVVNGKHYGMPLDIDVWGLYVNQTMVDAYNNAEGREEADKILSFETWDDVYSAAVKLTQSTNGVLTVSGYPSTDISQRYFSFLSSAGSTVFNEEGFVDFSNDDGMYDYMTFVRRINSAHVGQAGMEGNGNFVDGKLAMTHGSSYTKKYIEAMAEEGFEYTVYPQPKDGADGTHSGLLGGYSFALPARSNKMSEEDYEAKCTRAWKFIEVILFEEDAAMKWMETCGSFTPLESLWESDFVKEDAYLGVMKDYISLAQSRPSESYFTTIESTRIVPAIEGFIKDTSKGVADTLASMDEDINRAIEGYKQMQGMN